MKRQKEYVFIQSVTTKSRFKKNQLAAMYLAISLELVVMVSGCSSVERSRALGDPNVQAKTLALQVCANCHGVQGIAISPIFPNLAAQMPQYFEAQLKSYKSHARFDQAGFEYMWGISARLTDDQISGLATYFSSQKPAPGKPQDPKVVAEGQAIFEHGIAASNTPACAGCHGPKGEGLQQFPRLAGQHADYIMKQLIVFQRTDERPEGHVMKAVAQGLTRENINSIASYLEGMPYTH